MHTGQLSEVVGENIRRLRREHRPKLSQGELARRANLSRTTIARLEGGRGASVDMASAAAMAEVLGVTVDALLRRHASGQQADHVKEFLESVWCDATEPTDAEVNWLRRLDDYFWKGLQATPQVIAQLLFFRRQAKATAISPPKTKPAKKGRKKRKSKA